MDEVVVLIKILDWSPSWPPWQRDAKRRFDTHRDVSTGDFKELVKLCPDRHGLEGLRKPKPLETRNERLQGAEVVSPSALTST